MTMILNYFLLAFRHMKRRKGNSFLSIFGLVTGMAIALVIFLWVRDECSYDRFHHHADRIFRVANVSENQGAEDRIATTSGPLAGALKQDFPWVEKTARIRKKNMKTETRELTHYEDIFFADKEIFDIFTIPLVKGNPKYALSQPKAILISQSTRKKYFGNEEPMGKTITLEYLGECKITGVFEDIPRNSHIHFHFLAPMTMLPKNKLEQWGIANYYTYVLAVPNAPTRSFERLVPALIDKYMGKGFREMYKQSYLLQPLTRIHLFSHLRNEIEPNMPVRYLYLFAAIGGLILLVTLLNYINLSTSRFVYRAREVGLRKALGADRVHVYGQFLAESFLMIFVALPFSILTAEILLPILNSISEKTIGMELLSDGLLWTVPVIIFLALGIIAGVVPAVFTNAFRPSESLKGNVTVHPAIPVLRRIQVVFQFSVSILLVTCTLFISNQLSFVRTWDLGLNKEKVVSVPIGHCKEAVLKWESLKNEFAQHSNIMGVTASAFFPGYPRWNMNSRFMDMPKSDTRMISGFPVDYDFIDALELDIIEGRGFSKEFSTDGEEAFIINEAALREFGRDTAAGKRFNLSDWRIGNIAGVVKNFNFDSLHTPVAPAVLYINPGDFEYIFVRMSGEDIPGTLKYLKSTWEKLVPGITFEYSFLDEAYEALYHKERKTQTLLGIFSVIAIISAILGLFGQVSFTVGQKTKEVGIRKVLGAPVNSLFLLLAGEFIRPAMIGTAISLPMAWFLMGQWLTHFAYRPKLIFSPFLVAAAAAAIITLLTVSYQVLKAVSANPVDSLRYE